MCSLCVGGGCALLCHAVCLAPSRVLSQAHPPRQVTWGLVGRTQASDRHGWNTISRENWILRVQRLISLPFQLHHHS